MTNELQKLVDSPELLEVGRRAIEDMLIEMRDARMALVGRRNGLVCKEKDGSNSFIIRMGPEMALRIGIQAIIDHVSGKTT